MTWSVALRLGRVSNLPTVWSNVLAGVALAGGSTWDPRVLPLLLAFSLLYTAGMFLNDAVDWKIDVVERPERPIPSHQVSAKTVYTMGGLMLIAGLTVLAGIGHMTPAGTGLRPLFAGLVLCGLILWYDCHHKKNPFSPVIMGACRLMVYVTAAFAVVAQPSMAVLWGGLVLCSWLVGLTSLAKQETLDTVANLWPLGFLAVPLLYSFRDAWEGGLMAMVWVGLFVVTLSALYRVWRRQSGDIGRAVGTLIAGISLLDAFFILQWGDQVAGLLAIGAFTLTILLQRLVPGT